MNYLSGSVIALLGWDLFTLNSTLAILVLVLSTVKVYREDASPVLDNLVLVPAVLVLQVNTLEVVLSGDLNKI